MVLLYVLIAIVFINCLYFSLFFKFSFLKPPVQKTINVFPVSVIICAKNEAENLKTHLPFWLQQDYPNFELILINDASADDTLEVMESFANKDARIEIVNVENNEAFWGNKKYALTLGIKRAKNKRMLFTDADCYPASDQWITQMASHFTEEKQLILGYGGYKNTSGLLNKLIRFETLMTAVQYFSYAKAGIPYMGVGRNLGYTSTLYYKNNGFMSHIKVASGDDDLFVNEAATKENTAICFTEKSFTYSIPKNTWKQWIFQKKRHITTSKLYKRKHKILLGAYYVFNALFWICSSISLLTLDWKIPAVIISFRFVMHYVVIGKAALKLKENDLILLLPFYDLFLVLMQLSIFISNRNSQPTQWK